MFLNIFLFKIYFLFDLTYVLLNLFHYFTVAEWFGIFLISCDGAFHIYGDHWLSIGPRVTIYPRCLVNLLRVIKMVHPITTTTIITTFLRYTILRNSMSDMFPSSKTTLTTTSSQKHYILMHNSFHLPTHLLTHLTLIHLLY